MNRSVPVYLYRGRTQLVCSVPVPCTEAHAVELLGTLDHEMTAPDAMVTVDYTRRSGGAYQHLGNWSAVTPEKLSHMAGDCAHGHAITICTVQLPRPLSAE